MEGFFFSIRNTCPIPRFDEFKKCCFMSLVSFILIEVNDYGRGVKP